MNFGIDYDGVISAFPSACGAIMSALTAAGHHVYVITGVEESSVTKADVTAKKQALTGCGIGPDIYFRLIVCPKPHAKNKAQVIQDNDIAVLFDNDVKNVKKAKQNAVAFLLWNSKQ